MDDERTIARVIDALKEPVRIDPSFDSRVMAAIERLPEPARPARRVPATPPVMAWLRRRTIRLSPLGALALAAGLAAVVLVGSRIAGPPRAGERTQPGDDAGPTQLIHFVLVAPAAESVAVVGDFNDWNLSATPLAQEAGDGMWWVTLPLSPGRYRYAFVVNGTSWRRDPDAPTAEDEFGRPSSVVSIGGA